ncbi:hypothetical protein G6F37_003521 [Rhizopus arrhizus]|nr:hypothetical protein G6F38_003727 [Rhizopus arrhizus]KAG1160949.1 hypothetical protein G6F37_003521 [Rhizopus arrhizus]
MLPAEILQTIFSHLSYPECYKARSVCQQWKQEVEYYLYQSIKQHQQKLFIAIKGWKVVPLLPSYFDAENKVIEFLPPNEDPLEIALTTRVQLLFSEWKDYKNDLIRYEDLELDDLAQVIFHSTYNPSKEQLYEIPPPLEALNNKIRYIGDPGVILSFSYNKTAKDTRLYIHSVRVHISWLLSGIDLSILPQEIYADRYSTLAAAISNQQKIRQYNKYSEAVLRYIMTNTPEALELLLSEMSTNEPPFVRQQLQVALKSMGIDPRVIWKYNFVKNYILKGGWANNHVMEIIELIQESERKWQTKRKYLLNK